MPVSKVLFLLFFASVTRGLARFISQPDHDGAGLQSSENSCNDCTQLLEFFTNMHPSSGTQELMKDALAALCQSLPEDDAKSLCLHNVDKNVPLAVHFLTRVLSPGQVCAALGLCSTQSEAAKQEILTNSIVAGVARGISKKDASPEVQISPECTFCVFVIKKIESLLPKERTEDAVVKVMDEVCDLLPSSYKDECDNFVNKYGKDAVEFLLSYAAPHTICTLLHLCLFQESPLPMETIPSDCDTCRTLAALTRVQLGSNATETETSGFFGSVCLLYPQAVPKCELFIQRYGPVLQGVLGKEGSTLDNCGRADLCVTVRRVEPLGRNHCTWGNNYRCRDEKIAQECNCVAFCQKYIWK
ncbi:surfactant protein Bb [Paramormyrops kingsleyae]|uniref:Surfactant protein Bb n=1 Tax=Paramormyrops kingsleyae TaxID=1676925 RepID=A0A3B3TF86_9TELE|nr:prosaposin-like [Paramormyrops kingsleyae]